MCYIHYIIIYILLSYVFLVAQNEFIYTHRLIGGSDNKLIYRHYATLYFVFCVDSSESELGILDLIQVLYWQHDLFFFIFFLILVLFCIAKL